MTPSWYKLQWQVSSRAVAQGSNTALMHVETLARAIYPPLSGLALVSDSRIVICGLIILFYLFAIQ